MIFSLDFFLFLLDLLKMNIFVCPYLAGVLRCAICFHQIVIQHYSQSSSQNWLSRDSQAQATSDSRIFMTQIWLSQFAFPKLLFLGIVSHINQMHSDLFLRVSFWKNPALDGNEVLGSRTGIRSLTCQFEARDSLLRIRVLARTLDDL